MRFLRVSEATMVTKEAAAMAAMKRNDSPTGVARAARAVIDISRLAGRVLPAYLEGNASVEGYVKLARDAKSGASIAAERSSDRVATLEASIFEPLAVAADTAYGTGRVVSGVVRDGQTCLSFRALSSAEAPAKRASLGRGGILGVLALDASGAPVDTPEARRPDGRTSFELARALERLRRSVDRPSFELELSMSQGGAVVRATADGTVLVVVEPGVDLGQVSRLAASPSSFTRLPAEPPKKPSPAQPEPRSGFSLLGVGGRSLRVLLGRGEKPKDQPPARPGAAVSSGSPPSSSSFASSGASSASGSPASSLSPSSPRAARPSPLPRAEVERTTTELLRAVEEYVGPRLLDRLLADASPSTFAWKNRRVVLRAGSDAVEAEQARGVYREVHGVFSRGATLSNALRDFDLQAFLLDADLRLGGEHERLARGVLTGEA